MKKITLFLSLLAFTLPLTSQNLISDGTFSTQTGAIDGTTTPWLGFNAQVLGSGHAQDPLVGNVNNGEGSIYQNFNVTEGTTYQVTFDYRWVSTGSYNMTVRFRNNGDNSNLTISDAVEGTLNGANDGFIVNTTADVWYSASFRVTIPSGVTNSRLLFYKGTGNRPFRVDNVSVRKLAIFDGSTDSDWATADNWDTGEIPSDDDVIIPSGQTVVVSSTTGADVGNLTVDSSGSLTINGGGSLDVNGTSTGNITYNRTLVADKWHLVSSPVVGATYDNTWISNNGIASGTGNNRGVSTYQNGAANVTTGQWEYVQDGGSGTFDSSKGYALRRSSNGTVSFTGTYPKGALPFTASINDNAYNLVGNPYPLYLSVSDFFTNNTAASGKLSEETIWIWDQTANSGSGGYVSKTSSLDGTFQIAPGQGFFVSSGNASNIIFYEFNGTHQTDTFLKSSKTQAIITLTSNNSSTSTELYYLPEGTDDFDNGYDASKFAGVSSSFSVYTSLLSNSSKNLGRQVLSNTDLENLVVPIGIKADTGKELTFTGEAVNFPENINLYLEDRLTNTVTRLNETDAKYKITLSEDADGIGRFYLHTKSSSVLSTEDILLETVNIFTTNNSQNLRIVGLFNNNATTELFNIAGQRVFNQSFSSKGSVDISLPKLAKGIYIVKLSTDNNKMNKKIVIE